MKYLPAPSPFHYALHSRQKLLLLAGLIFALLFVFVAVILANQRTSWTGRAQTPVGSVFSRENSYLFASPIAASANGTSIIRVTVFLLNNQGLGVVGQKVDLSVSAGVTVAQTQPLTDSFGRAIFDTTSSNPGDYTISASSQGMTLLQKVSVAFH